MGIELQGFDELKAKIEKLKGIKTGTSLLAGCLTLQKEAMANAPVDTGFMRSSAESKQVGESAEMSFGADYSLYVEVGTSRMAGRFYVTKAINEKGDEIVKAVGNQMKKEIGG